MMNNIIKIEDLFAAGFQYGHKAIKSTPKMKAYIHSFKWGIAIIDLSKTAVLFNSALNFLYKKVKSGGKVLFVGTKFQAKDLLTKVAIECHQFYINKRWLGGSITNHSATIVKKTSQLEDIERQEDLGNIAKLSKKEQGKIKEKKTKLLNLIEGVRKLDSLPDVLVVVDAKRENIAILEAKKMGIPVIVLADTDTVNPEGIEYIVPGNDDGIVSIEFFLDKCKEVIMKAVEDAQASKGDKA